MLGHNKSLTPLIYFWKYVLELPVEKSEKSSE